MKVELNLTVLYRNISLNIGNKHTNSGEIFISLLRYSKREHVLNRAEERYEQSRKTTGQLVDSYRNGAALGSSDEGCPRRPFYYENILLPWSPGLSRRIETPCTAAHGLAFPFPLQQVMAQEIRVPGDRLILCADTPTHLGHSYNFSQHLGPFELAEQGVVSH